MLSLTSCADQPGQIAWRLRIRASRKRLGQSEIGATMVERQFFRGRNSVAAGLPSADSARIQAAI